MSAVLCDPKLPDNDKREERLQLERLMELARREPQLTEPEILQMCLRRAWP